jgi:hypothetical protein
MTQTDKHPEVHLWDGCACQTPGCGATQHEWVDGGHRLLGAPSYGIMVASSCEASPLHWVCGGERP